jgi:hypothetical protein
VVNVAAAVAGRTGDSLDADEDEEEEEEEREGQPLLVASSSSASASVAVNVGRTEAEEAAALEVERQVAAIEKLEGERKLAALPMAAKVRWGGEGEGGGCGAYRYAKACGLVCFGLVCLLGPYGLCLVLAHWPC